MISYIAIGSNQADPVEQAKQAITALNYITETSLISCSSLYCSAPMGPQDQPDYINAVAAVETNLSAIALLDALQAIEQSQGRERKAERWGPRTLDLDILLYAEQVIDDQRLTIPHYGMKDREFVLYPLFEIAPELTMPDGTPLIEMLKDCDKNGLTAITG
ncbi:2-amino-4-hydroxy-6-hydroxymethyldihydropteridine diphosphokinase [Psychromonas sp. B3M02]|uniref:2-amino-4-hydroxy-6- hydroxymethyldihydropteridine diphosphokinase n=1 Tax=unclassified Psychromonas TaxID=2614957 RepID=UPI000DEB9ED9|nr:2-amino-4-hydroxy-6-hydroxymethyldihydropteridine diphosphokinase [Psychromonas sp. B3M02]RBW45014.1 2-amino-4-hydroxy-6-hydroxymethyldihydropteridine diphosphokinase [Psychromonas sp. B3M02]